MRAQRLPQQADDDDENPAPSTHVTVDMRDTSAVDEAAAAAAHPADEQPPEQEQHEDHGDTDSVVDGEPVSLADAF